jgi:hypothetical protein
MPLQRFTVLTCIDGFEVIDSDGRAVDHRSTLQSANGVAFNLNNAAKNGPRALARALKAA